jgi:hypothetical protein
MSDPVVVLDYAVAREHLRAGDVLLFRGTGFGSRLIRRAGRSDYSHAALVLLAAGRVLVAESREPSLWPPAAGGCRVLPLSSVLSALTQVDVYRVDLAGAPSGAPSTLSADDEDRITGEAWTHLGQPYGTWNILRLALGRLLLPLALLPGRVGAFVRGRSWYSTNDLLPSGPAMVCSEYVARCYGAAGLDLVPRLSDRDTEPGDLARCPLLAHVATFPGRR